MNVESQFDHADTDRDNFLEILTSASLSFTTLPLFLLEDEDRRRKHALVYEKNTTIGGQQGTFKWQVASDPSYGFPDSFDYKIFKIIEGLSTQQSLPLNNPVQFSLYKILQIMGLPPFGVHFSRIRSSIQRIAGVRVHSHFTQANDETSELHSQTFHLYDSVTFQEESFGNEIGSGNHHIKFGSLYLDSLNQEMSCPIDLQYFQSLEDSITCRIYEILTAKYLSIENLAVEWKVPYLELCQMLPIKEAGWISSPQRSLEKFHQELIDTDFLDRVEWTKDSGEWSVRYVPGQRARDAQQAWIDKKTDKVTDESAVVDAIEQSEITSDEEAYSSEETPPATDTIREDEVIVTDSTEDDTIHEEVANTPESPEDDTKRHESSAFETLNQVTEEIDEHTENEETEVRVEDEMAQDSEPEHAAKEGPLNPNLEEVEDNNQSKDLQEDRVNTEIVDDVEIVEKNVEHGDNKDNNRTRDLSDDNIIEVEIIEDVETTENEAEHVTDHALNDSETTSFQDGIDEAENSEEELLPQTSVEQNIIEEPKGEEIPSDVVEEPKDEEVPSDIVMEPVDSQETSGSAFDKFIKDIERELDIPEDEAEVISSSDQGKKIEPIAPRTKTLASSYTVSISRGETMSNNNGEHSLCEITYHMAWTTKFRDPILNGDVANRTRELIREICAVHEAKIVQGVVAPDHVNIKISCPPTVTPGNLITDLKDRTLHTLLEEFPSLSQQYWGHSIWSVGYLCTTMGSDTDTMLHDYLESHKPESSEDETFQVISE